MEYFRLPDVNGLAALRAVVEKGGVEAAGRLLHIGQPAVTKRLRSLEACYGIPLMQRDGRRLILTTAGKQVYEFARLVLDRQRGLIDDLESLRCGECRLRLEVNFAIGERLLPDLLLRFADTHPDYRIESRMGYSRGIETNLAAGLADLALLERAPDHPDILAQKWLDDELLMVCGRAHRLRDADILTLDELAYLEFVLREPQSSMRITLDEALAEKDIKHIPITMEVGATDTIIEMLGRGRHVSFLPRFAVEAAIASGDLCHIRVAGLRIMRTLWIARPRSMLENPAANAFIRLLREMPRGAP
jgi:DNA-binding transcriptional LysR family regulator